MGIDDRRHGSAAAKIVIGFPLILIAVGAILYATGWVYAGIKKPSESYVLASSTQPVCTTADVAQYNAGLSNTAKVSELATQIKSRKDYTQNATCMYIVVRDTMRTGKSDEFANAFGTYKDLLSKGNYPHGELADLSSVVRIENEMKMIQSTPADSAKSGDVQG